MKLSELFSDPSKHCKGAYARSSDGSAIMPCRADAVQWCVMGGLDFCYPNYPDWVKATEKLRELAGRDLATFNDSSSFELIKSTIEKAGI